MVKVTFGILALNSLPFLEYNLRALYPFAHQIIVVEGAVRSASALARPDGHSMDGTLEMLQRFKRDDDPGGKLLLVTATEAGYADGFWPEKDEMSQAYATRANGNWLWQVDSDEFYLEEDMTALLAMLSDSEVSSVSFPYCEFFGGFESCITGEWHLHAHPRFHRLFRWGKGYSYSSHRPPTVLDEKGRSLRDKDWLINPSNEGKPIRLHHYSYVFPKQALQKVGYYSNVEWSSAFRENQRWYEEQYFGLKNPLRLGELGGLQWLERFSGEHPAAIQALQRDLKQGVIAEPQRGSADIEKLLDSNWYKVQTSLAALFLKLYWPLRVVWKSVRNRVVKFFHGR